MKVANVILEICIKIEWTFYDAIFKCISSRKNYLNLFGLINKPHFHLS